MDTTGLGQPHRPLIRDPLADRYPYPFPNPDLHSVGEIVITRVGVLVAFVLVGRIVRWGSGSGSGEGQES